MKVASLAELMAALEVSDEEMLDDGIQEWIGPETFLEHPDPETLVLAVGSWRALLRYPFDVNALWAAAYDLEESEMADRPDV